MFCDVSRITPEKKIHLLSRVRETIGHTNTKFSTRKKQRREICERAQEVRYEKEEKWEEEGGKILSEFPSKKKRHKIFKTNNRPQSRARAISANHPSSDKK